MHSWIAASMSPSHRRPEKDARRKISNVIVREQKPHGAESFDPDLLCKIIQSNRPSSLLSPSYNTLSKSCDDMSKCGSNDAGSRSEEGDKIPLPLETIINDKKYIGLVPAAYVSRSKSHNDIIIHRRLVNPNRSKTPNSLPSAYMEERYVIRIKKGVNPHKLYKSSSDFLKPSNELCRSFSAQNLNAESSSSSHGSGSGGGPQRHEIITTFGCAPNSAPSSREISPESVFQKDTANGNYHHHHHHHHHQHYLHHQLNTQHQSEKMPGESAPEQEQSPLLHNNNNNNNHKTSNTTGNIAKSVEQQKKQLHLNLPRPERRHSYVGGQTSYPVSIKSPIRSTDTHSFLSMDGLKKLLSPGGKKTHKEVK